MKQNQAASMIDKYSKINYSQKMSYRLNKSFEAKKVSQVGMKDFYKNGITDPSILFHKN